MSDPAPHGDDRPQEIAQHRPVAADPMPAGKHVIVARQDFGANGDDRSHCLIRLQAFNADGSACGSEITIDAVAGDNLFHPAITALADGRFALAWEDLASSGAASQLTLRVRVFNADGSLWEPTV